MLSGNKVNMTMNETTGMNILALLTTSKPGLPIVITISVCEFFMCLILWYLAIVIRKNSDLLSSDHKVIFQNVVIGCILCCVNIMMSILIENTSNSHFLRICTLLLNGLSITNVQVSGLYIAYRNYKSAGTKNTVKHIKMDKCNNNKVDVKILLISVLFHICKIFALGVLTRSEFTHLYIYEQSLCFIPVIVFYLVLVIKTKQKQNKTSKLLDTIQFKKQPKGNVTSTEKCNLVTANTISPSVATGTGQEPGDNCSRLSILLSDGSSAPNNLIDNRPKANIILNPSDPDAIVVLSTDKVRYITKNKGSKAELSIDNGKAAKAEPLISINQNIHVDNEAKSDASDIQQRAPLLNNSAESISSTTINVTQGCSSLTPPHTLCSISEVEDNAHPADHLPISRVSREKVRCSCLHIVSKWTIISCSVILCLLSVALELVPNSSLQWIFTLSILELTSPILTIFMASNIIPVGNVIYEDVHCVTNSLNKWFN